jgi:hypothetical protein
MNRHDLGYVLLKIAGLFMLFKAALFISEFPFSLVDLKRGTLDLNPWLGLVYIGWHIAGGVLLIVGTEKLLGLLHINNSQEKVPLKEGLREFESFAVALLSVCLAILAIKQLSFHCVRLWQNAGVNRSLGAYIRYSDMLPWAVGYSLQLLFAVFLFLGRRGVVRVWASFRPLAGNPNEKAEGDT